MKRILIIVVAVTLLTLPAVADVPQTMNIQGVLTDAGGNVLPDGDYSIFFQLWDAPVSGSDVWGETEVVHQRQGVFSAVLGMNENLPPQDFVDTFWLSLTVAGEDPMEPRIMLTSAPYALRAGSVDPGAAVRKLNGMTNSIEIVGGANVTVTQVDTTLVIAATGGGTGDDGDWLITGNDVSHAVGRVYVGYDPVAPKDQQLPPPRGETNPDKNPASAKVSVLGYNEGVQSVMMDSDALADGRAAIFGRRQRTARNDGAGYADNQTNTGVTGYNDWGDSYTFGVAGYTWFDFNNTGGVLGARNSGTTWASLAYRDSTANYWGLFTPNNAHVGGLFETQNLRLLGGATTGYILTSDALGNASWQPPAAATSDGDWEISGDHLTNGGVGSVAIGTAYPHPLEEQLSKTTMQVSALFTPALALDKTYGGLSRWLMYQSNEEVVFSRSTDYASAGTTAMKLAAGKMLLTDAADNTRIRLQTYDSMESGSRLDLYSTSTSTTLPVITLDSQQSSSNLGGSLTLRDGVGQTEVELTANYNNTGIGRITTPVLEITGGADLSEQFDLGTMVGLTKPGLVVSIDPENPGRLALSAEPYDHKVAGVISGAGGVNPGMVMGQRGTVADGELPVALVGRVYVWADASSGPIAPGDLLTTSARPGHAMKVADHAQAAGAILGKAMSGLQEGQGLILTLVTLQ
jgi:hypothetical protein